MFDRSSPAARVSAGPTALALALVFAATLALAAAPPAAADLGKVHAGSVSLFPTEPSTLGISLRMLANLGCPSWDPPSYDPPPEECAIEVSEPDRTIEVPQDVAWAPIVLELLKTTGRDGRGLASAELAVRRVDLLSDPIALPCGDFRVHLLLDTTAGDAVSELALRFEQGEDAGWLAGPLVLPLRVVLLDGYRQAVAETTLTQTLHLFSRWSGTPKPGYEKTGALAVDTDGDGVPDRTLPPHTDLHPFLEPAGDPAGDTSPRELGFCVPGSEVCTEICFEPPPDLTY
ncbi:MAG TPA: hypothetical protein VKU40_02530 [Thermoanaerobaculia bacterium]|nr:hypothetical protein [Thermoanaerobaculia bacterium]